MQVNIHCFHCCASCMIQSRNSGFGVVISKLLKVNKQEKLPPLGINTKKILYHVWAQSDSFFALALLHWLIKRIFMNNMNIWIEMLLLSQDIAQGTFFLFNICLIGMWPQPSSTSHSVLVCFGSIRQKAVVVSVFLSDEVWSSFSGETERAEAANFSWPCDPSSIHRHWPQSQPFCSWSAAAHNRSGMPPVIIP